MAERLRPFFPYYGSKWNIARYYPAPVFEHIIEPFAGGAGYATFYATPYTAVTLFDADPIIAGVWEYLIRLCYLEAAHEILALPDLPNVGDSVDDHVIPQEAKWLIGFWLNRGSAQPKKSRTAYSARTDRAQLNWGPRAKARIAAQIPALARWRVKCADYQDPGVPMLRATWFIDPPYGEKGLHYRYKLVNFNALGAWCRIRIGQVIVCEGPGASWLPFEPLGSFKSSKGRADEFVYTQGAPNLARQCPRCGAWLECTHELASASPWRCACGQAFYIRGQTNG